MVTKIKQFIIDFYTKEKELDIILSSDDIDPLIIQLIQDEKDNKK